MDTEIVLRKLLEIPSLSNVFFDLSESIAAAISVIVSGWSVKLNVVRYVEGGEV